MTLCTWILTLLLGTQGGGAAAEIPAMASAPVEPQVSSIRLRNTASPWVVVLRARIQCGREGVEMMGLQWSLSKSPDDQPEELLRHSLTCPPGRYRSRSLALDLHAALSDVGSEDDPPLPDHPVRVSLSLCDIVRMPGLPNECRSLTSSTLCILPDAARVFQEVPCEP